MQDTVNQRIETLINLLEKGKQSAFANKIGVTPSVINNIIAGRMNEPSFKVLQKITDAYADVNLNWLLAGTGEPLKPGTNQHNKITGNIGNLSAGDLRARNVTQTSGNSECQQQLAVALKEIELLQKALEERDGQIAFLKTLIK